MKRFLASALLIGASTLGLVGCDQEASVKKETEVKTPGGGTDKVTTETKEVKSGDAKDPAPATAPAVEAPK